MMELTTYATHSTGLSSQLEKWRLNDAGFAYNIVAVFGSQSTGKSEQFPFWNVLLTSSAHTPCCWR
jgi:hypothetical protein